MARRPRLTFPGAVYHAMTRGNRKSVIFHDDLDRTRFLDVVDCTVRLYAVRIYALCLMPNHYHIVLDTPRANLSEAMQYINGRFAQISNKRYDQTGHLFGGRFRSLLIQREGYLKRASRYVVRNPLRAMLVADVAQWQWSSYRATAGLEPVPSWLNVDWVRWAFKADLPEEAQRRYIDYVNEPKRSKRPRQTPCDVFGSATFKAQVAAAIRERHGERCVPRNLMLAPRPPLATLFAGTTDSLERRNHAIYQSRAAHGYTVAEIARFLGVHPSTVSRAVQRRL